MQKQVEKDHYDFNKYLKITRWCSVWYQVDEVLNLQPNSVLEVGPGPGIFKALIKNFNIDINTLDIAEDLNPDFVCSADNMPFSDNAYDIVCAFQMLEHVPIDKSLCIFKEMVRVSKNYVIISLPDAKPRWRFEFHIPKKGPFKFLITKPFWKPIDHKFDGEHYWEINKKNYLLKDVLNKFINTDDNISLVKHYRVKENPYHHFFIFKKTYKAG